MSARYEFGGNVFKAERFGMEERRGSEIKLWVARREEQNSHFE